MTDFFPPACDIVLKLEGALSNEAGDPGGETKWSIARLKHPEITDTQWAVWTRADSMLVLRHGYWDANRCGEMPWPWALVVFDGAVNQGSIIKLAQRALRLPKIDGVAGPATLAVMSSSPAENLGVFIALRVKNYIAQPSFPNDGDGWLKRIALVAMAAGSIPTAT